MCECAFKYSRCTVDKKGYLKFIEIKNPKIAVVESHVTEDMISEDSIFHFGLIRALKIAIMMC